jgi:hypothetical protein
MGCCRNSTVVKAPIEEVWAVLRNFHDFGWGQGVIETCEPVGSRRADQVGAQRLLNGTFAETLIELSDLERRLVYRITDGPGTPVSKETVRDFVGTIQARPVTGDGTTFVEWISSFHSAQDQVVEEFCNPIYQGLLDGLQARFARS